MTMPLGRPIDIVQARKFEEPAETVYEVLEEAGEGTESASAASESLTGRE